MQLLAEIVYKYEGTIDKYSNDGMMALFGVPLNHENDPERAVRAALDMQEAITKYRPVIQKKYGVNSHLRMGYTPGH